MIPSVFVLLLLAVDPPEPVKRDHGPGTSGGGLVTQSGETLKPGAVAASLRLDYTQFERLSPADINGRTLEAGGMLPHFDAARWTLLETLEFAFGATEDLQIAFSIGYYRANGVREGHIDAAAAYDYHEFGGVSGMTDQWLAAKYRVMKGADGSLALLGGVKLPFGDDNEGDEGGAANRPLEPALQPGSGTFDFLLGAAYSTYLSERVTIDASLSYTYRTEQGDYKIGDLALLSAAVAYRFTENVSIFPQTSLFLEAHVRHLQRNEEDGEKIRNSGGTVLFLSPGLRVGFSDRVSFTISPQIPVLQALHDEQQRTLFKVAMGLTVTF